MDEEKQRVKSAMVSFAIRVLNGTDNPQETAILPDILRILLVDT